MSDEAAGEVEPAPHPTRVSLGNTVSSVDQTELLQQLFGSRGRCLAGQLVEPTEHPEVLSPGQVLIDRGELTGQPDARPDGLWCSDHVVARHERSACIGLEQSGEHAHGRRLAGAVGPE